MGGAPKGAVAAGHKVTAHAAARILRSGGNAFDATLAALFASCVCEPVLSSPGGGGFLMALKADESTPALFDFFVQTPHEKRAREDIEFKPIEVDFGTTRQRFLIGMGASATPGFVAGCYDVHAALATLPMAEILQPAIAAAKNGVVMNGFQARLFKIVEPILLNTSKARKLFAPDAGLLGPGDLYKNPHLAETFKTLGREGCDFFYTSGVCDTIIELAATCGGHLSSRDFSAYTTRQRCPIAQPFGETGQVFFNPAPAAGGCLIGFGLALARILEGEGASVNSALVAKILARIDHTRREMFAQGEQMLSDDVLARCVAQLQNQTITSKGTTHISVIDAEGNAAAATVSNGEGNGHMAGDFGFMLNNMLGEEDLNPQGFNLWPCDKRLSSMMAPTLIRHGSGALSVLGSGGANRIRSAMVQVLLHLRAGKSARDAVDSARLHYENGKLDIESGFDEATLKSLMSAHDKTCLWDEPNMYFGGVHMVHKTPRGSFEGAGDLRRDGCFLIVD